MPRTTIACLTVLSGFLLVSAQAVEARPPHGGPPMGVIVENSAAKPVPVTVENEVTVTGTVTVGNTPLPVTVQNAGSGPVSYGFVGFSEATVRGNAGIVGLNAACAAEGGSAFPVGARACFSKDILESRPTEGGSGGPAWVIPTIVGVGGEDFLVDASGPRNSPGAITCSGWTTGSSRNSGLAANDNLGFFFQSCDSYIPVACCSPK